MVRKKFYIICYDISDTSGRNAVAELLESYGTRVNFSVFECMITAKQLTTIKKSLTKHIDISTDIILFYNVCVDCFTKAEQIGRSAPQDGDTVISD
ncbi:MAG TPA: CRISPR-associated endonuclease Cas2 [Chitinophagales bacterium]|nr:CRISPR-associated endonuclease Cas2 [Saprospiraceae bacterium]HNE47510.1 CRISPR-associated endonuclease Cas2 [Chitinophagales bacterium]HNO29220.1 CRISPR-associated endonuclease Cas2 [Chitinophagales bacterium]